MHEGKNLRVELMLDPTRSPSSNNCIPNSNLFPTRERHPRFTNFATNLWGVERGKHVRGLMSATESVVPRGTISSIKPYC